jgi:glycerol-3-phosphate acyltransferase PlsY
MPLILVAAYLIGSVPFAVILARRWGGADLRRTGSGNVGATNVLRTLGVTPGVLVALLDMMKGAASVLIARQFDGGGTTPAAAGVAAVVGHVFPVWLGFRGGKGVAAACGVFWVLAPIATLVSLAVFVASIWISRYVSVGSVLASATLPPVAYATHCAASSVVAACAIATLIILRHRTNLVRVHAGTERRVGLRERSS